MTVGKPLLALALISCLLTGCTALVGASRDTPIEDDRGTRTLGSALDDNLIETKVAVNIAKQDPQLDSGSHIVVVSYNGIVLLAGQTPSAELKRKAEQATQDTQRVRKVYNELQITAPSSLLARSNDAWLTSKIKAQMLSDKDIPGARIKIVTENGIVYLMGLVTRQEATRATNLVQGVSGVQKIVKLFEYID